MAVFAPFLSQCDFGEAEQCRGFRVGREQVVEAGPGVGKAALVLRLLAGDAAQAAGCCAGSCRGR